MTDALHDALAAALGEDALVTDAHDLARYEKGWRYGEGSARLVARPRTHEEVAECVRLCNEHGARVQPAGANTGLVGASTPDGSGQMVVLSLERLSRITNIDDANGSVEVEGGVLLSALNETLKERGRSFPIDLGADPQIGGMVATNTGGSRLVRYGDVRANLLGLRVVLPDGSTWSDLRGLRKNNTGLDAKQLFVGTSGAFGIVTGAVLRTWPLPEQRAGALVEAESGDAVVRLFEALEPRLGEFLTAYEAMSAEAVSAVLRHGTLERSPFPGGPPPTRCWSSCPRRSRRRPWTSRSSSARRSWSSWRATIRGSATWSWATSRTSGTSAIRSPRASARRGRSSASDVSVPRSRMAEFTAEVARRVAEVAPDARVADFGHWGDGGSHLNLVWDPASAPEGRKEELQRIAYDVCVTGFGGSYSAEHCVGPHNVEAYREYTSPWVREVCARIGVERFGTVEL